MAKCTNRFLSEGYKLIDPDTGNTIAVLINGEFKKWEAGNKWRSKEERIVIEEPLLKKGQGLVAIPKTFKTALKDYLLNLKKSHSKT